MAIKQLGGKVTLALMLAGLAVGSLYSCWRERNPPVEIQDVRISSIEKYVRPTQDGPFYYYDVTIPGYVSPIQYTSLNWDDTVKSGDIADIRFIPQLFDGLEGIAIDDHK